MHRLAWLLIGAALVAGVGAAALDRPWSTVAAGCTGALLISGLVVSWFNGKALQRQWQSGGVRGTLRIERAKAEFTGRGQTRYAIDGHLSGGGQERSGRFRGFVPQREAGRIEPGAELAVTVLAADPRTVRLHLHDDRPDAYVILQAR